MPIAVIADIVGSRRLPDRESAQHALESAIADAQRLLPVASQPLQATVGDELQAVYPTLTDALASLLLVQLGLPGGLECRFGLGIGAVGSIASASGPIPDGPGWWAARSAIDHVHALQQRAVPSARTWIVVGVGEDAGMEPQATLANAYLLSRDQLVGAMSERARRLARGRCLGATQVELAAAEGISQSAVSQALASSGAAAVVEAFRMLRGGVPA